MRKLFFLLTISLCAIVVYASDPDIEDKPYNTAMELSGIVLRGDGEAIFYISGTLGSGESLIDTSQVYYEYPNVTLTVTTTAPGDDSAKVNIYVWEGDASDLADMNMMVADTVAISAAGTIVQELNLKGALHYMFIAEEGTDNGDSTAISIRQDRNRY